MKKPIAVATVLAAALVAVSLLAPPATTAEELDAKALFTDTHKCNMCHSVPAAEIAAKTKSEKMKGPELGGKIEGDFETIAAYVRKAGELDGKNHKKEFKGTDEELQTIIDWLGSLEAQE